MSVEFVLAIVAFGIVIYQLGGIKSRQKKIAKDVNSMMQMILRLNSCNIKFYEFSGISLQYLLIGLRTYMFAIKNQTAKADNFEEAEACKQVISEIEKLIALDMMKWKS